MNNPIEEAKKLRDLLLESETVKEYLFLKAQIEFNEELEDMKKQIALATSKENKVLKDELLVKYNAHPLINNFNIVKDELISLLTTIKNIISE